MLFERVASCVSHLRCVLWGDGMASDGLHGFDGSIRTSYNWFLWHLHSGYMGPVVVTVDRRLPKKMNPYNIKCIRSGGTTLLHVLP